MKTYTVTVELSHESFGGYDHKDGRYDYVVTAKDRGDAKKKALKISKSKGGGYCHTVVGVN